MVIFGLYLEHEVPFHSVYLHGLVNDAQGKKMSKSKGNVIDPLTLIEKYGTDALRMALVVGNTPGTSLALAEDKIKGYKNFANKLWNITRFVLMSLPDDTTPLQEAPLTPADTEKLSELTAAVADITKDFEEFRFYMSAEKIYHYTWHTFADKIIEESKAALAGDDAVAKASAQRMLLEILTTCLKVLHPFMPFVTEELYSKLPLADKKLLMVTRWPL